MDSISQAALGAAVAGVVAGKRCSAMVLLAGAGMGTLPDLDVFLDYGDPISNMIKHRGFTHSLFVLLPFSGLLAGLLKRFYLKNWPLWQLYILISLTLITHPVLDSFTAYGTQLFWPLALPPVSISSLSIIDPLYTLPLFIPVLAAFAWPRRGAALCALGLSLSTLYLIWSLVALALINARVERVVAGTPLEGLPVSISATPFNTVLWRIVVLDGPRYWEGLASLLDESQAIEWMPMSRGAWPFSSKPDLLKQFEYFTQGFVRYKKEKNELSVIDLRLGMAMYHPFRFVMATQNKNGIWALSSPEQRHPVSILREGLPILWMRLLGSLDFDPMLCREDDCFYRR